jgi:hypothetical protein
MIDGLLLKMEAPGTLVLGLSFEPTCIKADYYNGALHWAVPPILCSPA